MKHKLSIILQAAVLLAACSQREESGINANTDEAVGVVTEINAEVPPFIIGGDTKTFVSADGVFYWVAGENCDKLGFWPEKSQVGVENYLEQSIFYVRSASGKNASFAANGWGLLIGKKYYSYYPYDANAMPSSVAISYEGQGQSSNGNTDHLGKYDYMHSYVNSITGKNMSLTYSHLGCVCKFVLPLPSSAYSCNFTEMNLTIAEGDNFVYDATYNPSVDNVEVAPASQGPRFSVKLNGDEGFSPEDGGLVVYAMMSPMQLKDKTLNVSLTSASNIYAGSMVVPENQIAGKGYLYELDELVREDTAIDLSRLEAANCYIVSAAGNYKFKLCKGNNKGESLESVSGASVIWGNVVPTENLKIEDDYMYFTIPENGFQKGNALLAAKDASNNILWSWHIWCTDKPADNEYRNNAGFLMDRNLGATEPASAGLYYQFGRKDPFSGGTVSSVGTSQSTTVDYTVAHPTTFITAGGNATTSPYLDWNPATYNSESKLWSGENGEKTLYDPCPPGYRVAEGSTSSSYGFMATALDGNYTTYSNNGFSNGVLFEMKTPHQQGQNWYIRYAKIPLKEDGKYAIIPTCGWYAEGGEWHENDDNHALLWFDKGQGSGSYNSDNWNSWTGGSLDLNCINNNSSHTLPTMSLAWNSGRAAGKNVRCQKMTQDKIQSGQANESFGTSQSSW